MVTKGSVLVVDDEINLCRIIGAKLARSGYNVVAVHDGAQAVQKVRESDFDVVLLDLILPKMDGLRALAEIRGIRSAVPVIVMTACENAEAMEQAKSYGVSAYVNKPFDLDNLVSLVTNTSQSCVSGRDQRPPESTLLFSASQPVTIEVQNGCGPRAFGTQIIDKDERTLSVLAPVDENGPVYLPPRASVRIGLVAQDAHYSFTTQVLRTEGTSADVLVLDKPSVIYRIQRREHPRRALRIPVRYALGREGGDLGTEYEEGETRDLSAGGACLNTAAEVPSGEVIRIELRPKTDQDKINAVARVLRSKPADEPGDSGFYLGCQFVIADPSLQNLLKD